MPYKRPSLNEIVQRIIVSFETRLNGKSALLRRALLRIIARVFAGVIHTCYGAVDSLVKQLFITTATGKWLDRHGLLWKILRKAASYASGQADFTVTGIVTIPKDTRIQSAGGVEYGTVTEFTSTASGVYSLDIQAIEAGASGNLEVDSSVEFEMISPIGGVSDTVIVASDITGGQDREEDEPYRRRLLFRIQNPPMGGNPADYIAWATQVAGVDQAWSYPLAFGAGSVAVVITSTGLSPVASSLLISDTSAYIASKQPIGANVYTQTVEDSFGAPGTAKINYSIEMTPNLFNFQEAVKTNLKDLFKPFKPGDTILIADVRSAIKISGVDDYTILAFDVDGAPVIPPDQDYTLPGFAYPELGTILFTEKA